MSARRPKVRDLSEGDRRELALFCDLLGVVERANDAGGRDFGELYDAIYGAEDDGVDRRDFTKVHS